VKKRLGLE
jgi:hypothetical protein